MQTLINASGKNCQSQVGAFFIEDEYGFSMHFATQTVTDRNTRLENWHCMSFRQDFIETLRDHGRLPPNSYR